MFIMLANLGIPLADNIGFISLNSIDSILECDKESGYKSIIVSGSRQFRSLRNPLDVIGAIENYRRNYESRIRKDD